MADKTILGTGLRPTGQMIPITAGENGIEPGMYLYADTDGKVKLAKRNSTLAIATALYCAMSYADLDDTVYIQDPNTAYDPGFVVTVGEIYVLGTGFGGIEAVSDLAGGAIGSGHFLCLIGIGSTEALLDPVFKTATAAHP